MISPSYQQPHTIMPRAPVSSPKDRAPVSSPYGAKPQYLKKDLKNQKPDPIPEPVGASSSGKEGYSESLTLAKAIQEGSKIHSWLATNEMPLLTSDELAEVRVRVKG
jgi:hypothetical protein